MLLYIYMLIFIFSGMWIFSSNREHLLSMLLSLEYMVLCLFLSFILSLTMNYMFYSLFYLVFSSCEGALGLSILVMMSRSHGGDYFKSFSLS
uniref:NADH-ubiquinone oxidoreductase chain 4L n=1 Tax=Novacerus sp. FZ-2019 TaxID=2585224 RepID=A0A6H0EY65_9HEXA|nr:NADH dehydrogenase subunit 4L [Novacerus sp. FZ-2019]